MLSIIAGAAIPLESFLSGQLFNIFISYNAAEQFSDFTLNITNFTCTPNSVRQLLAVATNDSNRIFCDAFQQGNVLNSASEFACNSDQTLIDEATTFSLYFVYVAVGTFVTHFIAHILWTVSASRQSRRMRIAFYRSVLQHKIGWFETKDTSQLEPLFLKYSIKLLCGDMCIVLLTYCLFHSQRYRKYSSRNRDSGWSADKGYYNFPCWNCVGIFHQLETCICCVYTAPYCVCFGRSQCLCECYNKDVHAAVRFRKRACMNHLTHIQSIHVHINAIPP